MDELIFKVLMLKGEAGNNITSIEKTSTTGIVDTYTITLTDGTTTTFEVTNGSSIQSIEKTSTTGLVDTYTITLTDGSTTTFEVTNGKGIENIEKTATSGLVDTYTITFTDGSTTTFEVTNGNSVDTDTLKEEIYKEMYPVGAVFISFDSTNPAKYNTVWERTGEGRMLLGVSDDYEVESTGGEAEVTLSVEQMPNHRHNFSVTLASEVGYVPANGSIGSATVRTDVHGITNTGGTFNDRDGNTHTDRIIYSTGGGQAHNNMPPYIAVYMWRRVS